MCKLEEFEQWEGEGEVIVDIKKEIKAIKNQLNKIEMDKSQFVSEEGYCELLDDEGPVTVAGCTFGASRILKTMDPIAYRCGFLDYADSIELENIPEYADLCEQLEELDAELELLKEDLEE